MESNSTSISTNSGGENASKPSRTKLDLLQVLRAIAASMVILCHLGGDYRYYFKGDTIYSYAVPLKAGVDLFFVLSGFIITFVHWNDIGKPAKLSLYVRKRVSRIVPLYWGLLIISFAFFYWHYHYSTLLLPTKYAANIPNFRNLILSAVFLSQNTFVSASWTLCFEMLFYFFFCFSILWGKNFLKWSCIIWALIVIGFRAKHINFDPAAGTLQLVIWELTERHIIDFLLGVGVAAIIKVRRPKFNLLFFSGAAILFFIGLIIPDNAKYGDFCHAALAFGAAGIVLHLVTLESNRKIKVPSWLMLLGDASYSTYLGHLIFLDGFYIILCNHFGYFTLHPTWWQLTLLFLAVLPCTLIIYYGIEKPFTNLARKILVGKTQ